MVKPLDSWNNSNIEFKKIGALSKFRRGSFPQPYDRPEWYGGANSFPFVQVADIGNDMRLMEKTKKRISSKAQPLSVFVPKETVVISLQGTIGRVALTQYDAYVDRTVAIFQDLNASVNKLYFLYQLQAKFDIEKKSARGSTIKTITKEEFTEFLLPIPEIDEQKAIATTLSDIEEHIDNLTELIEKKKAIRDGALEDLVSGRTRVDGFDGEWERMELSKFANINPSCEIPNEFHYVDLESVKGITLINARKEKKQNAPSRAKRLAKYGDVFFQTVRPYQKNNYLFKRKEENYVFSTGYAQLRTDNSPEFLFLLIRNDKFVEIVLDNCTGTSYPAINPKTLGKIEVYIPKDYKEQQAIASIIAVMDAEIRDLEDEKAKMVDIREGAMDDLLTGRVRLTV